MIHTAIGFPSSAATTRSFREGIGMPQHFNSHPPRIGDISEATLAVMNPQPEEEIAYEDYRVVPYQHYWHEIYRYSSTNPDARELLLEYLKGLGSEDKVTLKKSVLPVNNGGYRPNPKAKKKAPVWRFEYVPAVFQSGCGALIISNSALGDARYYWVSNGTAETEVLILEFLQWLREQNLVRAVRGFGVGCSGHKQVYWSTMGAIHRLRWGRPF
ncbi:hypothetical protein M011DRAFT_484941 [Sporormia fimetaria CBS 119925]|uniref:Uncharacterized protein n=1 Tax=Sporormia fimetaria CBS 119925 TaxID=1340428 RepID=A0A6A6VFZ5_9PLEO|nr:hypothetical protein M011DRAFT_484941 [Sporormia fimetaria CBS 119925]